MHDMRFLETKMSNLELLSRNPISPITVHPSAIDKMETDFFLMGDLRKTESHIYVEQSNQDAEENISRLPGYSA